MFRPPGSLSSHTIICMSSLRVVLPGDQRRYGEIGDHPVADGVDFVISFYRRSRA